MPSMLSWVIRIGDDDNDDDTCNDDDQAKHGHLFYSGQLFLLSCGHSRKVSL